MATTIPTLPVYTGKTPVIGQTQPEFNTNRADKLAYDAQLFGEEGVEGALNTTIEAINTASAEIETNAASAEASATSAEQAAAALGYKGEWTPSTDVEIGGIYGYQGSEWRSLTGVSGVEPVEGDNWHKFLDQKDVTVAQEELIAGNIFPDDRVVEIGDEIPVGTTHLRALVGGSPSIVDVSAQTVSGTVSLIDDTKVVTDLMTSYLYSWSAKGLSKKLHLSPTGGDDAGYLKAAFERGGEIDLGAEGEYLISDEIRATITNDIKIISRGAVIKYNGAQVVDDVKTLIHLTGDGSQVVETEIIMDGGLTTQNNFVPVCLTVNGALMWRENSKLSNAAAGANPVNVGFYLSDSGVFYKNMIQTTADSSFGGTYGYGFVAVNVGRGRVNGGVFGTKDEPIHRHSIYISTLLDGSGNCGPFTIDSPIIEQLRYSDDGLTPVTSFEYCIKSISSESVAITGAIVNGGNGFILLTTRPGTTSGTVTYDNCYVRTGQRGVALYPEEGDETAQAPWARINGGSGNLIVLTAAFASAMRLQMVSSVIDHSTYIIENTTDKTNAYDAKNVTAANPVYALFIYGTIYDFQRVFSGGNVNNLDVDVRYVNPDQTQYPFQYTAAIVNKNIMLRLPTTTRSYYKLAGNAGLSDIKYYDEDFKRVIRNVDPTTPIWEDENGNRVSGNLVNRPDYVPRLHPFWEIDQNRFVYWTGSTWWTSKLTYPEAADTATILNISDNIVGNGALIYNTTNKKPYWYDDALNQWKDATGTVLV